MKTVIQFLSELDDDQFVSLNPNNKGAIYGGRSNDLLRLVEADVLVKEVVCVTVPMYGWIDVYYR